MKKIHYSYQDYLQRKMVGLIGNGKVKISLVLLIHLMNHILDQVLDILIITIKKLYI